MGAKAYPFINGHMGPPFWLRKGVRQGCPLSALLYVCSLDPLLNSFQKQVSPISIGEFMCPSATAYADDITMIVTRKEELGIIVACLREYAKVAGSSVNYNKSKALWYGKKRPFSLQGHFSVENKELTILGIVFSKEEMIDRNWKLIVDEGKAKIEKFKGCTGNLFEKVQILKTYILPLFIKLAMVFPVPREFLTPLYAMFFRYIWGNGLNRVKRGVTYHDVREGGLKMINPEVFLCSLFLHFNLQAVWSEEPPGWAKVFYDRGKSPLKVWEEGVKAKRIALSEEKYPVYIIRMVKLLNNWGLSKEEIVNLSRKEMYERIVSEFFKEKITYVNSAGTNTGANLKWLVAKGMPNIVKTVNWYATHNKLLVKCNIRHTPIEDRSCARDTCAGVDEDQNHLFVACPFVRSIWRRLMNRINLQIVLNYREVVYGMGPGKFSESKTTAINIILAIARYYIWNARCAKEWNKEVADMETITKMILRMGLGVAKKEKEEMPLVKWNQKWAWYPTDVG
nr:PREDICTED: uncharacterized protein LOC106704301 [Latimeria chalumnae]|eukprot:XP_014346498.1 PREDICTED: uncharacterized protein LOC106704301 [Latimeria chalumnae]